MQSPWYPHSPQSSTFRAVCHVSWGSSEPEVDAPSEAVLLSLVGEK